MTAAEILVMPAGDVRCVYTEVLDLGSIGSLAIRRASHVEPDGLGRWWADLSPAGGPTLGPFRRRGDAVDAEVAWLRANVLAAGRPTALV